MSPYEMGIWITGIIAGLLIWGYAIFTWGVLFGIMFGWIPAIIGGFVAGVTWPVWVYGGMAVWLFLWISNK